MTDLLAFSNNQQWVNKLLKQELITKFCMKDLGMATKVLRTWVAEWIWQGDCCNALASQNVQSVMCSTSQDSETIKAPFLELVVRIVVFCVVYKAGDLVQSIRSDSIATKVHWITAKRVLFSRGRKQWNWRIQNKTLKDLQGTAMQTGEMTLKLAGRSLRSFTWSCRKQATVALSTTEAKYMTVSTATQEALLRRGLQR